MRQSKFKAFDDYKKAHGLDGYSFLCDHIRRCDLIVFPPYVPINDCNRKWRFEIKSLNTFLKHIKEPMRIKIIKHGSCTDEVEFNFDSFEEFVKHVLIVKLAGVQ